MYYVETPAISSIIDVMKTTVWGESGFPARFLEDHGHGVHFSNLACKVPSSLDSVHGFRLSTVPKTVSITLGLVRVTPVTSRSRPQAVPHRLFVDPQETRDLPPRRSGVLHAPPHWKQSKMPKVETSKATELGDRAEEGG